MTNECENGHFTTADYKAAHPDVGDGEQCPCCEEDDSVHAINDGVCYICVCGCPLCEGEEEPVSADPVEQDGSLTFNPPTEELSDALKRFKEIVSDAGRQMTDLRGAFQQVRPAWGDPTDGGNRALAARERADRKAKRKRAQASRRSNRR